jgi:hypothetical protein
MINGKDYYTHYLIFYRKEKERVERVEREI